VIAKRLALVAAAAAVLAPAASARPAALGFDGAGNRTLAPFTLPHAETLRWQTSGGLLGGLFALRVMNPRPDVVNPQLVFAKARSGSVKLAPGRYVLRVTVLPGTRWTISVA
jgi:hypothetical protein